MAVSLSTRNEGCVVEAADLLRTDRVPATAPATMRALAPAAMLDIVADLGVFDGSEAPAPIAARTNVLMREKSVSSSSSSVSAASTPGARPPVPSSKSPPGSSRLRPVREMAASSEAAEIFFFCGDSFILTKPPLPSTASSKSRQFCADLTLSPSGVAPAATMSPVGAGCSKRFAVGARKLRAASAAASKIPDMLTFSGAQRALVAAGGGGDGRCSGGG